MNFFTIRTSIQNTVREIVDNSKEIKINRLNWYKDEIQINDIVYILISGDKSKKEFQYDNGLRALGKITYISELGGDGEKEKDYYINISILFSFNRSITKDDFYIYPGLKNAGGLGATTINEPNQAIRKLSEKQNEDTVNAIADLISKQKVSINDNDAFLKLTEDLKIDLEKITKIETIEVTQNIDFDITQCCDSIEKSGLLFDRNLIVRVIASLQTKQFVLLTGLSGSGKTQLALSIAKIFNKRTDSLFSLLTNALNSEKIRENYKVVSFSDKTIELINESGQSGKIIPIPTKAVYEWYNALKSGIINEKEEPRETRHVVGEKSNYQKHIHGFYNEFYKIATEMMKITDFKEAPSIKQYEIISVGSDWTNREPLLGFPNALKYKEYVKPENGVVDLLLNAAHNQDLPFFLILDEMNLSHVERYFADFLSVMESGETIKLHSGEEEWGRIPPEIIFPKNVFVLGTVNIDETTYMFSPKVLDRANVIEFRVNNDNMQNYLKADRKLNLEKLDGSSADMANDFLSIAKANNLVLKNAGGIKTELINFFNELKIIGAEFGYRSASEILRFAAVINKIDPTWTVTDIIDAAIMQKLLPKVHGSRKKLEPVLKTLGSLCLEKDQKFEEYIKDAAVIDFSDTQKVKYPVSLEKIIRMYNNLLSNGFTSYAEA